jgi:hypothetical protein
LTGLLFNWTADLIAIVAPLEARASLALAGMDVGTSFGGIGSSRGYGSPHWRAGDAPDRVCMAGCRLDPAFDDRKFPGYCPTSDWGRGMVPIALVMVALAENAHSGRQPDHAPRTHHGA